MQDKLEKVITRSSKWIRISSTIQGYYIAPTFYWIAMFVTVLFTSKPYLHRGTHAEKYIKFSVIYFDNVVF